MSELFQRLSGIDRLPPDPTVEGVLLTMLLAFLLGQALAWVYVRTHSGLSYSRSFTQSIVVMAMAVAVLMSVIGDSIVTAFGLLGALALVRFRNVLKDTRDTVFILMAILVGIATGTERYMTGILGTASLLVTLWYLDAVSFGTLSRFDGYLTLRLAAGDAAQPTCEELMHRFCRIWHAVSKRHAGEGEQAEVVYRIGLRDRSRDTELVEALRKVDGVSQAALLLRDELTEV